MTGLRTNPWNLNRFRPAEGERTVSTTTPTTSTIDFNAAQPMIDRAKAKGITVTFLPVPGGDHTAAWAQPDIIKQIFDFFDAHKTKAK